MESHDVIIVGGGPTGLSAARRLTDLGIRDVVVLEREAEAGGIPRHCGHLGFGWQSHRRLWSGPRFATELRKSAKDLDVRTATTVIELGKDGQLRVQGSTGITEMKAKHVLIATGTRETPRSARFVGGSRPQGVMNTGALQQHVYLYHNKPFERPVIIGSELVSFSALLTCRHLGIRPVAMLEENPRISAQRPGDLIARFAFGVPVRTSTRLISIEGPKNVEAVEIERRGKRERIACDGVIFTGQFRPETALFPTGLPSEKFSIAGNAIGPAQNFRRMLVAGRGGGPGYCKEIGMKVLAIDQGTTATKSFTLDESGRFESVAAFEHKQIYPNAGWVEHDAEELLRNVRACLEAAGQGRCHRHGQPGRNGRRLGCGHRQAHLQRHRLAGRPHPRHYGKTKSRRG